MKQWHVELAVFLLAVVGAFSFAFFLAQTVGLHPLIVPPPELRHKHVLVALGAVAFVAAVDGAVLFLIVLKHRRQAQAAVVDHGPAFLR